MKIEARAYAKINWLLEVGGIRPDGYHELSTLFQTIDLYDELSVEISDELSLEIVDSPLKPDDSNLVLRAARALKTEIEESGFEPSGARIKLRKKVPIGAGLGGGSSDAAATLIVLNELWSAGLTRRELAVLGAQIGSDVPFFLTGGTAWGTGRGTDIEPIDDIDSPFLLLVNPRIEVSTARAYRAFDELTDNRSGPILTTCSFLSSDQLFTQARNSLEPVVERLYPEVAAVRNRLISLGGDPVMMSGSGATVWARFSSSTQLDSSAGALDSGWLVIKTRALGREEYWRTIMRAIE
jgi:4-diphosphocytidyl-2-C-methyl-D-erythritol kinase